MDGVQEEVFNQLPAGRYEFKDSGIYIGEWLNEKAVGIGLLTKDKSQGEFTGLWNSGSEKCGVFLWPSAPGAMYEGEWSNSKRDGYGIFIKEDWIVMGKFQEGFITLGVKTKEKSIGKFEGEFEDGCPVFGMETYADGGTYCGDYKSGLREGLGVRTSIPYGEIFAFLPEEKHLLLKSNTDDISTTISFNSNHIEKNGSTNKLPNKFKCGFVLSGKKSELLIKKLRHIHSCKKHQKELKRSKSLTSIFSALKKKELYNTKNIHKNHLGTISVYSVPGNTSPKSFHSSLTFNTIQSIATMDLSAGDTIAPDVYETYSGEWIQDQRHGFGVCERSDGVIYEGNWLNNKRHGFGITKFADGSFEEGQYQNGKLIFLWTKRNPIFFLHSFRMGLQIKKSVKQARNASKKAQEKDIECRKKLSEIRETVKKAKEAATLAREYSLETRQLVKEMYPDYEQPGIRILTDIVRMMRVTKRGQKSFESMLQASIDVLEGKGVPEMMATNENLTVNYNKDNFLLVDSTGEQRASRHGSFRRSKKLVSQNASKELKSTIKQHADPNQSTTSLKKITSQNCSEDPKLPNKLQQMETLQPVTFIQPQQTAKLETTKLQEIPIMKIRTSPNEFPKAQIIIEKPTDSGSVECKTPVNELEDEEIEEEIYVPVGNIKATSQIPQETLSAIITSNTHVDYFDHYSQQHKDSTDNILKSKIYSISSSSSNSNIDNPRRFTVPEIMTQEPVPPTPVCSILRDLPEEIETESLDMPETMILMDSGIRKRVSPMTVNKIPSRRESKITLSQPQDELRPLPMIFNFASEVNLRKDLREGSLPDVSVTRRKVGIPREEVIRLGEEYQHAIELDKQKLKQGVFVIRFYKLGDWLRDHGVSLVVIFINVCLLYFFLTIIKDYKVS